MSERQDPEQPWAELQERADRLRKEIIRVAMEVQDLEDEIAKQGWGP